MDSAESLADGLSRAAERFERAGEIAVDGALPGKSLGVGAGDRLPARDVVIYGVPMLGVGYMFGLVNFYLLKFSTDVLLMAPATMGLIFGVSRLWDAVFDLPAGYLSDRTRSRFGRRRPWLFASAVPIGFLFVAMWAPPRSLAGMSQVVWMSLAVVLFHSAQTLFNVPHSSLGAELTRGYHDRTRVFAARLIGETAGLFIALVGVFLLERSIEPRATAEWLASVAAAATVALIVFSAVRQREPSDHQGRGGSNPYTAFADVWRNPHARLLLITFFIELLGVASLSTILPYASEYILHTPGYTSYYLLCYLLPFALSIPFWPLLSRRFGKRNSWILSMVVKGLGFGACFFLGEGDWLPIIVLISLVGIADGCGRTVAPSLQADVIDYDEYRTGERKEGAYFAAWNLAVKAAMALAVVMTGVALQLSGFQPNVEQTEATKLTLRVLVAIFPLVFCGVAATIALRFRLNETEHAEISSALERARAASRAIS